MTDPIYTNTPDPAWSEAITQRQVILWLGSSTALDHGQLERLLSIPWRAVLIDGVASIDGDVVRDLDLGERKPRFYSEDAGPERVPPNRVPFYDLRGPDGGVRWHSAEDAAGLLRRMQMITRWSAARWVFCIGVESEDDWSALQNAQRLSDAFRNLILVSQSGTWDERLGDTTDSAFVWRAGSDEMANLLASVRLPDLTSGFTAAVRTTTGQLKAVDLSDAIDHSSPISEDFDLLPAAFALQTLEPTEALLRTLLEDSAASWEPYAADVPFPRGSSQLAKLQRLVEEFVEDGPAASMTAWLDAEPASGATTVLRQMGLTLARQGFPVLAARSPGRRVDFSRLKAFLVAASDRLAIEGVSIPELPWILLFDAEHVQVHWDVVRGVTSGLKNLQRSVLVLAVRPADTKPPEGEYRVLGRNVDLGPPLTNSVPESEVVELGEHFARFLPPSLVRTQSEWLGFLDASVRTTPKGRKSLFWLALRFWLFRLPGSGQTIRSWISSRALQLIDDSSEIAVGLLEVCALARYRLATPTELLSPEAARSLRRVSWDRSNPLGITLVESGGGDSLTVLHPLIGEEVLRLAVETPQILEAVGKESCLGLLDLELHVLGRLISRPAIASPAGMSVAESLVTTGLRVDQREAPRNYEVRDRIVALLEAAPDSLWDRSQVFNHHLARARRHLAIDPPSDAWTEEVRREQFQLSEYHLLDAIENVRPDDPDREESPLNLQVSLALTLDYRSRFEKEHQNHDAAEEFRLRADGAFEEAQGLDPDNSYVLENYARFKLRAAEHLPSGDRRTQLVVEAIALLDMELDALGSTTREEAILSEMARGFELLKTGDGMAMLRARAEEGQEAAVVALARLALFHSSDEERETALRDAEGRLEGVPFEDRTWLTQVFLYRVVSELEPLGFPRRLDLLQELESEPGFTWPLQLRLEFAALLFQAGDQETRRHGRDVFAEVREAMASSSATVRVPAELRFLADPASGFRKPLQMSIRIKNLSGTGRTVWAVPEGWYNLDVPLRAFMFAGELRVGDERDCLIQFTNFGPQAVPPTTLL